MIGRVKRRQRQHRPWAVLAFLVAVAIAWGSLSPGSGMPSGLPWDKASHFIGYFALAGLLGLAGMRLRWALGGAVLYGIAIEFAQLAVPGRLGGDWADILANTLGAACAVLILAATRRRRD